MKGWNERTALQVSLFPPFARCSRRSPWLAGMALLLLTFLLRRARMTQRHWWLLGAVALGIAIVMYLVFFCPAECH